MNDGGLMQRYYFIESTIFKAGKPAAGNTISCNHTKTFFQIAYFVSFVEIKLALNEK